MSEQTKFTEDELNKLKEIQNSYLQIQNNLGQISFTKLRLVQQIEGLNILEEKMAKQYTDTQENEKTFIKDITKKYGDGEIDMQTGIYKPKK